MRILIEREKIERQRNEEGKKKMMKMLSHAVRAKSVGRKAKEREKEKEEEEGEGK